MRDLHITQHMWLVCCDGTMLYWNRIR